MTEKARIVRFDLESYWHAGSGRGGGALLDAVVAKNAAGLPYLPGRTVKGLLRDAVYRLEHWGHAPVGLTRCLFGSIGVDEGVIRLDTDPGALGFTDARLSEVERVWLSDDSAEGRNLRAALFRQISSTAVDLESGTARRGSLRSIEVVIPLSLEAGLDVIDPHSLTVAGDMVAANWPEYLKRALSLIRAVGISRSRGLGRVRVTMAP